MYIYIYKGEGIYGVGAPVNFDVPNLTPPKGRDQETIVLDINKLLDGMKEYCWQTLSCRMK